MASGLVALLDDVAALTRLAAASLDDIGAAAGRAGVKAAGVVVDDAAVTPRYVIGLAPERELPIIWKIARGSLRNKLVFILPVALLLSAFLPGAITPLLMVGGAYLCFEAAEKIVEKLAGHGGTDMAEIATLTPQELEDKQVTGAVRTDFILSAEIMAIALSDIADQPILNQGLVLIVVALGITAAVYGAVGLIVKMDDIGLRMSQRPGAAVQAFGRGLVTAMPKLMTALSIIGTAAMLWVGGQIIVHGMEEFGFALIPHLIHDTAAAIAVASPVAQGVVEWLVNTMGAAIVGMIVGGVVVAVMHLVHKVRGGGHGAAAH